MRNGNAQREKTRHQATQLALANALADLEATKGELADLRIDHQATLESYAAARAGRDRAESKRDEYLCTVEELSQEKHNLENRVSILSAALTEKDEEIDNLNEIIEGMGGAPAEAAMLEAPAEG